MRYDFWYNELGQPTYDSLPDIIDVDEIDELLDNHVPVSILQGRKLNWHGRQILELVEVNGKLRAILPAYCGKCGKSLNQNVLLGSGLHNGAWCYVFDEKGAYITNLRDFMFVCEDHKEYIINGNTTMG